MLKIFLQKHQTQCKNPDPKAESWAAKELMVWTRQTMTFTAFEIHKDLVEKEGYDPKSDEYYAEVDKRIRLDFPNKFAKTDGKQTNKPTQTVASAKRSVRQEGRKTVKLTSSQVAIAKKLGVPLEEYAKQLKNTGGAYGKRKQNFSCEPIYGQNLKDQKFGFHHHL